jgi:hypothetical protein
MAKAIGLLLLVLGAWVGVEVMNHGVGGAFGGVFARLGGEEPPAVEERSWVGERAGESVSRNRRAQAERVEALTGE